MGWDGMGQWEHSRVEQSRAEELLGFISCSSAPSLRDQEAGRKARISAGQDSAWQGRHGVDAMPLPQGRSKGLDSE